MASAAILRSAARSLRLGQPLEQQRRCLLARQFSSSSTPGEGLDMNRIIGIVNGQARRKEEIHQHISRKFDMVSDNMDKQARSNEQLEAKIKQYECGCKIDLAFWVFAIPTTFLIVSLCSK